MPSIYGLTEDEISILKVSDPARCERLLSSKRPLENFIDTLLTFAPYAGKVVPAYLLSKTHKSQHVPLGQQWSRVMLNEFNRLIFGFKTAVVSICSNPSEETHKAIYNNINKINQLLGICDELLEGANLRSRVEPIAAKKPQENQESAKAQQKKSKQIECMKFDVGNLQSKLKMLKQQNQGALERIVVLEQERNELRKRDSVRKATEMLKLIEAYRKKHQELKQHFKSLYEKHCALCVEYASERTKYARLHDEILAKTVEKQALQSQPGEQKRERKTIQTLRDERNEIILTRINNYRLTGKYELSSQEDMLRLNEVILRLEKLEQASYNAQSALLSNLNKDLETLMAEKNNLENKVKEFREKEEASKKELDKYKNALQALTAQNQYSQQLWQTKGDQFTKLEAEKNSFERLLSQLKNNLVLKDNEIAALKSSHASFKAESLDQLDRKEQELVKFKAAQAKMQEKIEHLIAENINLQKKFNTDPSSVEKLAHEKVLLEARVVELVQENQQLLASQDKLNEYQEEIRRFTSSHQTAMDSILEAAKSDKVNTELLQSKNVALVRQLQDKRALLKMRQSEIESLKAAMSAQTSDGHAMTIVLEQYKKQYEEASASIQRLEQALREKKSSWRELNEKHELLKALNAQNASEALLKAEKVSVLKTEIAALKSRIEMLTGQHEKALAQKDALYEAMQTEWQKRFNAEKDKAAHFEKQHAEAMRVQEFERRFDGPSRQNSSGNTPPPPPYCGEDHQDLRRQLESLSQQNSALILQIKQLKQAKERVQPEQRGAALLVNGNADAIVQKAQASPLQQSQPPSVFQGAVTHNFATQTALSALSSTVVDMTGALSDTLNLSEISSGPNSGRNNGSNDLELTVQLEKALQTNQLLQHELEKVNEELVRLKQNSEVEELRATIKSQEQALVTISSSLKSAEAEKKKALDSIKARDHDIEGLDEEVEELIADKETIAQLNKELRMLYEALLEKHSKTVSELELLKAQQRPMRSNDTHSLNEGIFYAYSGSAALTEQSTIRQQVPMKSSLVPCQ